MALLLRSVQYGTVVIAANSASGTATLSTAVDTTRSYARFLGWLTGDLSYVSAQDHPDIVLTNSTTVTATTSTTNATNTRTVYFAVIQFATGAVSSIQTSAIVLNGVASNTATINSVDTTRAWTEWAGSIQSGASNDWNYHPGSCQLTDATTVTALKNSAAVNALTVRCITIEMASGYTDSVQTITTLIAAGATTGDTVITAVTDGDTMLSWGGWILDLFASNVYARYPYTHRTSTTNVRATRGATSATTARTYCAVVEFAAGYVSSRQAGQTAIATTTQTKDNAISSITLQYSLLSWLGETSNGSGAGNGAIFFAANSLTSTTNVRQERGSATSTTVTTSWEVLQSAPTTFIVNPLDGPIAMRGFVR